MGEYVKFPDDLALGQYDLSLYIADVSNDGAIATRHEYSIQLVNIDAWDAETGYNTLNQSLDVEAFVAGEDKNTKPTEPLIEPDNEPENEPVNIAISIDGASDDWENIPTLASAENQQTTSLKVVADETYLYLAITGNDMGPYFDLFIYTDGESGSGFQSFDWPISGADYLIQQGTDGVINLHKSTGTGWSWGGETSALTNNSALLSVSNRLICHFLH
ncbi:MAG: hypothetical protein ABJK37_21050 [Paraglaciecola sp.]|uniref:hypothetical protein n=1 Tax=Paraglaciecola sp. TaxID=1920173 RepID=UPI00329A02E2